MRLFSGADPEEKNSQGLTAFHVAVKQGHISIVHLFLETYPPEDSDSKLIYDYSECSNLISLALESHEPEIVWIILNNKLATLQEIRQALVSVTSEKGAVLSASAEDREKAEDIIKLLKRYGKFEDKEMQQAQTRKASPKPSHAQSQNPPSAKVPSGSKKHTFRGHNRGRGRARGRGRGGHYAPPAH